MSSVFGLLLQLLHRTTGQPNTTDRTTMEGWFY